MKKLTTILAALALILCIGTHAYALTATWTHDGTNTTGYTLYFWKTDTPAVTYNKSITGSTVRTMTLDDNYFQPGASYTFTMTAYNAVAESVRCPNVMWTRSGQAYQAPTDKLPSVVYVGPNGVNQIVITLP